jgi:hypothetical protein
VRREEALSEYQYYEFMAVDEPLTDAALRHLRSLSSRARISRFGFVNHYDYGNFKGDPAELMNRHFDLFLYFANWGARRLSLRFPARAVDAAELRRFCARGSAGIVRTSGANVIIDIERDEVDIEDLERFHG